MDKKGISVYLLITFGLGYLLVPALLYFQLIVFTNRNMLTNIVFLLSMWIPALAALIAAAVSSRPELRRRPLWPLPMGKVVQLALAIPGLFLAVNLLASLYWTPIDWRVGTLMNQINGMMQQPLPPAAAAIAPTVALVLGLLLSVILGPTFFAVLALGSELGWRGYLLPRLMPLGRIRAYLLSGVLWGAWFMPFLVGYALFAGDMSVLPSIALRFLAMAVLLSVVLGEVQRRTQCLGMAAIGLGVYVSQLQSIWEYLFPMTTPPWTGPFGLIALGVWFAAALVVVLLVGRERAATASVSPVAEEA